MKIVLKYPRAIRWFHWINFPLLALMIWSGIYIYWANDIYRIGVGDHTLFHFFPKGFYNSFGVDHKLAEGMAWHFFLMWLFGINGALYVAYTAFSGEWRYLLPNRHSFKEALDVILYDLHLTQIAPPPRKFGKFHKFNGAQQFAYTGVLVMGVGSLLTGLAIYRPIQLGWLCSLLGGYEWARTEHFVLMIGYVLFFLVHVSQVIRAGWNNARAMITGFEIQND